MIKEVIGLAIECYDPLLKTAGYSWKFGLLKDFLWAERL